MGRAEDLLFVEREADLSADRGGGNGEDGVDGRFCGTPEDGGLACVCDGVVQRGLGDVRETHALGLQVGTLPVEVPLMRERRMNPKANSPSVSTPRIWDLRVRGWASAGQRRRDAPGSLVRVGVRFVGLFAIVLMGRGVYTGERSAKDCDRRRHHWTSSGRGGVAKRTRTLAWFQTLCGGRIGRVRSTTNCGSRVVFCFWLVGSRTMSPPA